MGPEEIILINPPITTFQQSLTHSAMVMIEAPQEEGRGGRHWTLDNGHE